MSTTAATTISAWTLPARPTQDDTTTLSDLQIPPTEVLKNRYVHDFGLFKCPKQDQFLIIPDDAKAIILDFDGTTARWKLSEGWRHELFREVIKDVLAQHTVQAPGAIDIRKLHSSAVGHTERKMCDIIALELQKYSINVEGAEVWKQWITKVEKRFAQPTLREALVDGVREIITTAKDRGVKVAVCTMGAAEFVKPFIKRVNLEELIDINASFFKSEHQDIPGKPDGRPYEWVCEQLGIDPSSAVIFEDSATGVLAGLRAGARVMFQPSEDRYQMAQKLIVRALEEHGEQWIKEHTGHVGLAPHRTGWTNVAFQP